MNLTYPKILLTGPPRVVKTTLIKAVVARLPPGKCAGFYTTEILQDGVPCHV
jgi:nucleoside-triphosphatase THEP1